MCIHKDSNMKESRKQAELTLHSRMKSWSLVSLLETTELDDAPLVCNVYFLKKVGLPSWCFLILNGYMPPATLTFSAVS